jgi:hypothetical protein
MASRGSEIYNFLQNPAAYCVCPFLNQVSARQLLQLLQLLQEVELDGMESQRDFELVRQVLSYERDRVHFLLKSYLRARLEKIEQSAGESRSRM